MSWNLNNQVRDVGSVGRDAGRFIFRRFFVAVVEENLFAIAAAGEILS